MTDADRTIPHESGEPDPPTTVSVGRFVLGPELGRGAFGVVYRAYDPMLGREVAVKLPTATDVPPGLVERFTREARAAASLRHPNVVTVFDVGTDSGRPFIAMELVNGPTLAERLEARPTQRQAAEWVRDLALALHQAHAVGVLHRDVKPGNVLLDAGERVRLTDFGISKLTPDAPSDDPASPTATHDGTIMGSPGYMSPEQARGDVGAVGPASDQYSLGVVLYELLTGRRPFLGTSTEVIRQTADPRAVPPPPRELVPGIALGLEAIVLKAISKHPVDRYFTAAEFAVELQRWLKDQPVMAPLRLRGSAVRVCPYCEHLTKGERPRCLFCGRSLEDVPISDSADLPPTPRSEKRKERLPEDATPARMRAVTEGLWLLGIRVRLALWAFGLIVLNIVGFIAISFLTSGTAKNPPSPWAAAPTYVAIVFLTIGQLIEWVGLGCCLRLPAASRCRLVVLVALGCQLIAPVFTGYGVFLAQGPTRSEIVPLWPAKEPEPRYEPYLGQKREIGKTPYVPASGPPVWLLVFAGGALLGTIGWVASIHFLDRLGWYLGVREIEGQPLRILMMAVAITFGPPLILFLSGYVLLPQARVWLLVLLALGSIVLAGLLLITWLGVIDALYYDLRRRREAKRRRRGAVNVESSL